MLYEIILAIQKWGRDYPDARKPERILIHPSALSKLTGELLVMKRFYSNESLTARIETIYGIPVELSENANPWCLVGARDA